MPSGHMLLIALVLPLLTGCYQAVKPMISDGDAVFPFTRLTYKEVGEDELFTLVRKGDEYVDPEDETAPKVRFQELRPNVYLAQGHFVIEDAEFYSLAVIEADLSRPGVVLHAGFADKSGPPAEKLADHGFTGCDHLENMVCLDSLDPYLTYALARLDGGEAPDIKFEIISHE